MNIEELFDNEIYHNYGMLTTDDANLLINYLKTEVMEYVAGLQKRIAELECTIKSYEQVVDEIHTACDAAGCMIGIKYSEFISSQAARIAELEEQNLNMMALFRDFYELEFNRDECWEIIKKYGGDA